jgi:ribonuclease HI
MSTTAKVQVHFDGASVSVRGRFVGAWAFTVEGGGLDHEGMGQLAENPATSETAVSAQPGHTPSTNNVAEYTAAIKALEYLESVGFRGSVEVMGDSQLVIRQFTGEYSVKSAHLKALHERLKSLAKNFERVSFEWVPRELNSRADYLSKEALHGH